MIEEEHLKEQLFDRLSEYPEMERFFKDMLLKRVDRPYWMENGLVLLLLLDSEEALEQIEKQIKTISDYDQTLLTALRNELVGGEKEFDNQMHDIWAELKAANWLIGERFCDLRKIPKAKKEGNKTPDFECQRNGEAYLFEVKNLNAPNELANVVNDQFSIARLRKKVQLSDHINLKFARPEQPISGSYLESYRRAILRLIDKIVEQSRNGKKQERYLMDVTTGKCIIREVVECSIVPRDQFLLTWFSGLADSFLDKRFTHSGLGKKIIGATKKGIEQLVAYDSSRNSHKEVLLYWNRPSPGVFSPFDDEALVSCVNERSRIFNIKRPDIRFRLM